MRSPRFQNAIKALLLLSMSLFFYSRISNGSLYFYINQRFAGLVLFAAIGLIVVSISYQFREGETATGQDNSHADHDHNSHDHHHDHGDHEHSHRLSWAGVALFVLPMLLGVLIRPQPLGASALANREVKVGSTTSAMPAAVRASQNKDNLSKNILDWLYEFQGASDPAAFDGEEAQVVGFIFRDERLAADEFTVARFTVSCCVADASYVGLVVRAPDAANLAQDQWVQVRGHFEVGVVDGQQMPVLVADTVEETLMPQQPYLYP